MKEFVIGSRKVGPNHPPMIIAEMSGNHNQSLERALSIVDAAAESGAHALKLQTYTADTMTLDIRTGEFFIEDEQNLWKGTSLYELYQQAYTPWEWHQAIFDRCREKGVIPFSTPFDETAVDFLESLNVPCYKVASFENTDIQLLRKIAATGKPVIMSTGMATPAELDESVRTLREYGCSNIVLLKCTSTYPASPANSNLRTLPHMSELFQCQVGLSDHTLGIGVSVASVALGATVIEKHFTLSRAEGGVDSAFSMEPNEMKALVEETQKAWESLGGIQYGPTEAEKPSLKHRRSLYIAKDVKQGETLTKEHVKSIRPGLGLPTKYMDIVLGKTVSKDVQAGTPLTWDVL
ncbi:pseudaminic acid synthase [Marinicrinis lubricantis]|uniref:Pseudaminic acid synthase n=1 Tax=Marinicrinis lubricantis TaxID=2086470 RepID=A0ABW1IT29_9BACL